MATFWERAAHLVYHIFSLSFDLLSFISHFGFEGGTLVLIAAIPGHFLRISKKEKWLKNAVK